MRSSEIEQLWKIQLKLKQVFGAKTGANSVIHKDVPDHATIAGNPAKRMTVTSHRQEER